MTTTFPFTVRVTDDAGAIADQAFSINIINRREPRFFASSASALFTSLKGETWDAASATGIPANTGTSSPYSPVSQSTNAFIAFSSGALDSTTNFNYRFYDIRTDLVRPAELFISGVSLSGIKPAAFWLNNRWVVAIAVSGGNNARSIATSLDGLTWTSPNSGAVWTGGTFTSAVGGMAFGVGRYVISNRVASATLVGWSSTDLVNWGPLSVGGNTISAIWTDVLNANDVWYFVNGTTTNNPNIVLSKNLVSVVSATVFSGSLTPGCFLSRMVYGNGRLVIIQRRIAQGTAQPYPDTLFTSDDGGFTWTPRTFPNFFTANGTAAAEYGITFHRGLFYLWCNNASVGSGGLRVSPDAINWSVPFDTGLPEVITGFATLHAA